MTRGLLGAGAVAGALVVAWWLVPSQPRDDQRPAATTACRDSSECSLPEVARSSSGEVAETDEATGQSGSDPGLSSAQNPDAAAVPASGSRGEVAEPDRLREEADRLMAEGKVLEGIAALRRATRADPSLRNHADLGNLLARLTAFDEAARHLKAAAELDPGNADRWIALADVYYRLVDPGEAWKAERRAREAEPGLVIGTDREGRRVRLGRTPAEATPEKPN